MPTVHLAISRRWAKTACRSLRISLRSRPTLYSQGSSETSFTGPRGAEILNSQSSNRWQWIRLIKLLAYDPPLFDRAATLLARFLAAEPLNHNNNSASDMFAELFHLHLSGTQALPDQRRALVRRVAQSGNSALVLRERRPRCAAESAQFQFIE